MHLQSAKFVLLMSIQHLMERTDGVEQTAIVLETGPGKYGGVLCTDEPLVSEGADVLAHCYRKRPCFREITRQSRV